MKTAVITITIGDRYKHSFNTVFKSNLKQYCDKHKYDLFIIDTLPINDNCYIPSKFMWQRMLLLSDNRFNNYDYVLIMDSDILVNINSPPLPHIKPNKVGVVNERKYFGTYNYREIVQKENGWINDITGKDWYNLSKYNSDINGHINAGFIIYQPKYHADIMKNAYYNNIDNWDKYYQSEQGFLSIFFKENDMIEWIDQSWNCVWDFWKKIVYPAFDNYPEVLKKILIKRFCNMNYFCHFTSLTNIELL
jgi:hypothetical protein